MTPMHMKANKECVYVSSCSDDVYSCTEQKQDNDGSGLKLRCNNFDINMAHEGMEYSIQSEITRRSLGLRSDEPLMARNLGKDLKILNELMKEAAHFMKGRSDSSEVCGGVSDRQQLCQIPPKSLTRPISSELPFTH